VIEIKEVGVSDEKSSICNEVLRALPSWFGMEEGIVGYVKEVKTMPFFSAYDDGKVIGFVAIKSHGDYTAEVCVMGILKEYHRKGIGKKLIDICVNYCENERKSF